MSATAVRLRKLGDWRTWAAWSADARWTLSGPCPAPEPADGQPQASGPVISWPTEYSHPNAEPFVRPLEEGFATITRLRRAQIEQPYPGIVLIEMDFGRVSRRIALDYYDFTHVNERCAAEVDVYFKMQHLREGYPGLPHVVPGAYVTSSLFLYRNWCRLRALRSRSAPTVDVFGRFGLRFSADVRSRALTRVTADPRLSFAGGTKQTKQTWYLREMARARVCLDLPGQGPFCYRLIELMAMGCCVIGPRHATRLPVDLRPGVEIVHCAEDFGDLAELCEHYSRDRAARTAIGNAAAAYFDRHLHPVQLARYYVETARQISGVPA